MADHKSRKNDISELNLQQIMDALLHNLWLILLVSILCTVIAFGITRYLLTPQYQSAATFYVNNSSLSVGDASFSISSSDITASKSLVDSYIIILRSRTTLNDVIDYSGVDVTYKELRDMVSANAVNSTEIFEVIVTSPDPEQAEKLANAIAYILPKRIGSIIEGSSAKIVDSAIVAATPSSPSYPRNMILGFAAGLVLSAGFVMLRELFDTTIRNEEMVTQISKHPILAAVPNMMTSSKGRYYASDRRRGRTNQPAVVADGKKSIVGENAGFAASEAYKLLRTKIQFSFAGGRTSQVIGLSSAMAGEGKSITAVNLAYSLSQLDKRVILLDCDMRRPTLAEKLNIRRRPGLSSCLTGQIELEELIQNCGIRDAEEAFHVVAAGQNPPNPVELLSSREMEQVLQKLKTQYDYVVLDLPPVGEVSDALAVAGQIDGMLLVVRQDYCNRGALADTISQFEFIESKILGIVFNCASENHGRYANRYYKRYGYRYYSRYGGRFESSPEKPDRNS